MLEHRPSIKRNYEIVESLLKGKDGASLGGEDRIINSRFGLGVVDGATDSLNRNWSLNPKDFVSSGSFLADCIVQSFNQESKQDLLILEINRRVAERATALSIDLSNPANRPNASMSVLIPEKNQILQIGDCQLGILLDDGEFLTESFAKKVDLLTSQIRSSEIKRLLTIGIDPFAEGKDLGREKILPLIRRQYELVNRSAEDKLKLCKETWAEGVSYQDLFYDAIDGVSNVQFRLIDLPNNTKEIILCSDGYPEVRHTLVESELILKQIITEDPYAYQVYASTKGLSKGNLSFDDRSYLRLRKIS